MKLENIPTKARQVVWKLERENCGATTQELAAALEDADVLANNPDWEQAEVEAAHDYLTSFSDESEAEAFARYYKHCIPSNGRYCYDEERYEAFKRTLRNVAIDCSIDCPDSADPTEYYEFRDGSRLTLGNPRELAFSSFCHVTEIGVLVLSLRSA